jgi:hypothetical protein
LQSERNYKDSKIKKEIVVNKEICSLRAIFGVICYAMILEEFITINKTKSAILFILFILIKKQ